MLLFLSAINTVLAVFFAKRAILAVTPLKTADFAVLGGVGAWGGFKVRDKNMFFLSGIFLHVFSKLWKHAYLDSILSTFLSLKNTVFWLFKKGVYFGGWGGYLK